ncbi:hypothetical protein C8R44DRAFT_889147 [Mycena epipterygia]|nr:hypothetical protein C8R44DRAFT_889147 [Mycena epipterygia]
MARPRRRPKIFSNPRAKSKNDFMVTTTTRLNQRTTPLSRKKRRDRHCGQNRAHFIRHRAVNPRILGCAPCHANAVYRARFVENQLSMLGANILEDALNVAEQLRQMELCVEEEYLKLKVAETILEDVLRGYETPVVVPELLKLVVEMSDDL